jgi:hypothetical protein
VCEQLDVVGRIIPHLNDDHRWTRERIADWVESIERERENLTSPFQLDTENYLGWSSPLRMTHLQKSSTASRFVLVASVHASERMTPSPLHNGQTGTFAAELSALAMIQFTKLSSFARLPLLLCRSE